MKRQKEAALRAGIMRTVAALQAAKLPAPDAWMQLVLASMGAEELRREIASGSLSADELRWMQAELAKKERAK